MTPSEKQRAEALKDINSVYDFVDNIDIDGLINAVNTDLVPGITNGLDAVSKFLQTPEAIQLMNNTGKLVHEAFLAITPAMRQLSTEISTALFNYVDNLTTLDEDDKVSILGVELEKNFASYGKLVKSKKFALKNPLLVLSAKKCLNHIEKFGDYMDRFMPQTVEEDKEMSTSAS